MDYGDGGGQDVYASPTKSSNPNGSSVHRTPNGAMTRDVFRGGGGNDATPYEDEAPTATGFGSGSPQGEFRGDKGYADNQYADGSFDEGEEKNDVSVRNNNNTSREETFAPGMHPLEGVPMLTAGGVVDDLPTPEPISNGADRSEVERLKQVRTRTARALHTSTHIDGIRRWPRT